MYMYLWICYEVIKKWDLSWWSNSNVWIFHYSSFYWVFLFRFILMWEWTIELICFMYRSFRWKCDWCRRMFESCCSRMVNPFKMKFCYGKIWTSCWADLGFQVEGFIELCFLPQLRNLSDGFSLYQRLWVRVMNGR